MAKKGFTIVEVLIAIAISLILAYVGLTWYRNFQKRATVEGEVHKVYQLLKEIQLKAKTLKEYFCVDLSSDGKYLIVYNGTDCNNKVETIPLKVKFWKNFSSPLKVNKFGIWIVYRSQNGKLIGYGSFYVQNWSEFKDSLSCVKVHTIRVCEGYWRNETTSSSNSNGTCYCKF